MTEWFTNVLAQEIEAGVKRNQDERIDLNKRSLDYLLITQNLKEEQAMNHANWGRKEFNRKLNECAFTDHVKYTNRAWA